MAIYLDQGGKASYQSETSGIKKLPKKKAGQYMEGFSISHVQDGKVQWKIEAKRAHISQRRIEFEDINCTFFLDDGTRMTLTAKRGILDRKSKDIRVVKDVKIRDGPYLLETSELFYSQKKQLIYTDKPVRLTSNKIDIYGADLEVNLKTQSLVLKKHIETLVWQQKVI